MRLCVPVCRQEICFREVSYGTYTQGNQCKNSHWDISVPDTSHSGSFRHYGHKHCYSIALLANPDY